MSRILIAFVIVLTLVATALSAATTIAVRPTSTVKATQMIKLGDMAAVTGPKSDVERLNQVEIARSSIPGASRQITPEWIKARLVCMGFDPQKMVIKSPSRVVLVSESQQVKGLDIVETAKQYVTNQLSQTDITYTLAEAATQPDIVAPTGKLELVAEQAAHSVTAGRQMVTVDVMIDGVLYTKKTVGLSLKASGPVLVATQSIKAKESLTASNTRVEQRDIPYSAAGYVSTLPDDGAKVASRSISAGTAVTADMIAVKPAVAKGDPVIVAVKANGIRVVVKGTASQDGCVGDSIKVSVPTSRDDIQAIVTEPGLVEVRI